MTTRQPNKIIGTHSGYGLTSGDGKYVASVESNGNVVIQTVYAIGTQAPKVTLTQDEFDAFVAFIQMRRAEIRIDTK